jgi:hypothetical protein
VAVVTALSIFGDVIEGYLREAKIDFCKRSNESLIPSFPVPHCQEISEKQKS